MHLQNSWTWAMALLWSWTPSGEWTWWYFGFAKKKFAFLLLRWEDIACPEKTQSSKSHAPKANYIFCTYLILKRQNFLVVKIHIKLYFKIRTIVDSSNVVLVDRSVSSISFQIRSPGTDSVRVLPGQSGYFWVYPIQAWLSQFWFKLLSYFFLLFP